jgi:hypothetical protein
MNKVSFIIAFYKSKEYLCKSTKFGVGFAIDFEKSF